MANPYACISHISTAKYDERQAAFEAIRRKGPAIKDAIAQMSKWKPWSLKDLGKSSNEHVKTDGPKLILGVSDYMRNHGRGAFDELSSDSLELSYAVFGCTTGRAMMGEPTQGLKYKLEWKTAPIDVSTYTGVNNLMAVSTELSISKETGSRDRTSISKATGWDRNSVNDMTPADVATFVNLAERVVGGGNRFTRLVKGMLMYIELLENGAQDINVKLRLVDYTPTDVIRAARRRNCSYAFCSQPTGAEYLATLMLMGEEYPPPQFNSAADVFIPADGEHYVVVRGIPPNVENGIRVNLTAHAVYASISKYATEIGEHDTFEEAMTVAASLYYNRYLDEAALPTVNSTTDLLLPGFIFRNTVVQPRPHVGVSTLRSVGKLHQMQILLVIKDVIMSAKMTTTHGADYKRSAVDAFATYEMVMLSQMKNVTAMRLLERTSKMRWANKVSAEYIEDMDEVTIFECLWLAEHGEACMRDGGLKVLKDARKDGNDYNPYTRLLMEG